MPGPAIIEPRLEPYVIGRYEVSGQLAAGGMAEVLLARVVGPHGFERPVVIKRILPHLARRPDFVSMFVDEARIAARIQHPNVVHVYELGSEGSELFLAMEYLAGESLAGVLRRFAARGETMPPALAAYVVERACAGLHAAHELRGADGSSLEVVHRDVSPQNLFVGYDGTVKVLDFGIAKAKDRLTETETGAVKGKFGYMSPEQCAGGELDRRTDTFALSVILYEASTGRRLFKRESHVATVRAITDGPIPDPREIIGAYPDELAAVVLRGLSRPREGRFQTAAEMRAALVAASARFAPGIVADGALAERMQELFADRIAEKDALLHRLRAGSVLSHVPAAEADVEIEVPLATQATRTQAKAGRSPKRAAAIAIGALALAAMVSIAIGWSVVGGAEPEIVQPAIEAAPIVAPEPPAIAPAPAPIEAEASVTLRVETEPAGAEVWIDGAHHGESPLALELPRRAGTSRVELRRADYEAHVEEIDRGADAVLRLALTPVARRRPREPSPRGFRKFQ
jgi:hypothetical protein